MRHQEQMRESAPESGHGLGPARYFGVGLLVGLVIAGPTFLVEEISYGKPLIDHDSIWWVLPAAIMAIGFFVGGMIAARQSRRVERAFAGGVLVAAVTVCLIFIADLLRRHAIGKPLNFGVERLWVLAAIAAIVIGGLGGIVGSGHPSPTERPAK